MELSIRLTDNSSNTNATGGNPSQGSTSISIDGMNNGGAANFSGSNNDTSSVSSSQQLDIGGPPQWLTEALRKDQQIPASETSASSADSEETDGGSAPTF